MTQPLQATNQRTFRQELLHKLMLPLVFWPLMLVLVSVVGVLAYRQAQLRGVPDIGEPFDVEILGYFDVDPAENAYADYEQALSLLALNPLPRDVEIYEELDKPWSDIDDRVKQWVADNALVLAQWSKATQKKYCLSVQPADLRVENFVGSVQERMDISRLSQLAAMRAEAAGDFDEARSWLRSLFRYSRHVGMFGGSIERNIGAGIHTTAANGLIKWADFEAVTGDSLEEALREVQADYQLTAKPSVAVVADYFVAVDELNRVDEMREASHEVADTLQGMSLDSIFNIDLNRKRIPGPVVLFVTNEPELTGRLLCHQTANLLMYVDLTYSDWRQLISADQSYFDVAADGQSFIPAKQFQAALDRCFLREHMLLTLKSSPHREQARQGLLELILAAQWHRRIHREFPENAQQLVDEGMLRSIPEDAMSFVHEPIHYERDPDNSRRAKVWSVGENHVDDGGDLEFVAHYGCPDMGVTIGAANEAPTGSKSSTPIQRTARPRTNE